MLEYTLNDAETLLSKNLNTATKNLTQLEDDLDFLRDQLTTTEVSILFSVGLSVQFNIMIKTLRQIAIIKIKLGQPYFQNNIQ